MKTQGSNTGSAETAAGTFNAVDAFESLLNPPKEDDQKAEGQTEEEATEVAESEEPEKEDESADESTESEESADDEQTDDEPAASLYTVRVDGKEEQVSESELIAGYQRQADYTRKTQTLSGERKKLETEQASISQERSEYAQLLPRLRKALEQSIGKEPDWEALRKEDPATAAVEKQRWDERVQRIHQIRAEEERVTQQREEDFRRHREQILADEAKKVLDKLPHWKQKEVASKENGAIGDMLRDLGFAEDELAIYDSRAMQIAWMAMKYREIQKQKPGLQQKIEKVPVVKPGAVTKPKSAAQKAHQRFVKSGNVRDAAALFEAVL